jgi:hypothetical protein
MTRKDKEKQYQKLYYEKVTYWKRKRINPIGMEVPKWQQKTDKWINKIISKK